MVYTYDTNQASPTNGLLLSISSGSSYQESYGYDSFERLSSVTRTIGSRSYVTSYQQNSSNQHKQLTYPSTRIVKFTHDEKGRPLSVTNQENFPYLYNIGYNIGGQITGLNLGNGGMGLSESYGYDTQRLQMTSQSATKSGTSLLSLNYSYQAAAGQNGAGTTAGDTGQLMSASGTINGTTESAGYTYGLKAQLVTSSQTTNGVSLQRRFESDRWGNLTAVYDQTSGGSILKQIALELIGPPAIPSNRIASVSDGKSTVSYTYDAAGNLTSNGAHSFTYDAEDRVVSVDAGATAQYGYDPENRRVKKVAAGATVHYVWEGSLVVAEHNGSTGAVLTDYIYLGKRMIAKVEGVATRYFISDRLSVRLVLDSSGNVVGRQGHLPFGEQIGGSGTGEKHQFTSYERDIESGLDYAVNRMYSPEVARFQSTDPYNASGEVTDPRSWNRYVYSQNDPVNSTDSLGLETNPEYCDVRYQSCDHIIPGPNGFTVDGMSGGDLHPERGRVGLPPQRRGRPSQPQCNIGINFGGTLTPGNHLKFPSGSPLLGPLDLPTRWIYQVEVYGSVSEGEDVSTWSLLQSYTGIERMQG